jgi:solute carrier family 25 protein 38
MVTAARKMLAEEGVRSMWDGLGLRMSRKALSSALAWTVYEELIRRAEGFVGNQGVGRGKKDKVL